MTYDWDFSAYWEYRTAFLQGAWVTLRLSVESAIIGTLAGTLLGVGFFFAGRIRALLLLINDFFRAIPLLVLVLTAYYFPSQDLFALPSVSAYTAALIAMGFSQAVFVSDLVVSGLDRIPSRLVEAAQTVGLRPWATWRFVLLPDLVRQLLPSWVAFFIGLVKLSSVASVIGCEEIVFVNRIVTGQTFRSLEGWIIVAAIYVVLILPMTFAARKMENSEWVQRR